MHQFVPIHFTQILQPHIKCISLPYKRPMLGYLNTILCNLVRVVCSSKIWCFWARNWLPLHYSKISSYKECLHGNRLSSIFCMPIWKPIWVNVLFLHYTWPCLFMTILQVLIIFLYLIWLFWNKQFVFTFKIAFIEIWISLKVITSPFLLWWLE